MPIDVTDTYIRARVREPGEFQPDTFRTIVLSAEQGIKQIVGKLKGKDSMTAQSYLFEKSKWTTGKVRAWLEAHNLIVKSETGLMNGDIELAVEPERLTFLGFDDCEVKEEGADKEKHLYVEGFFTTADKDRHGDVIEKEFYQYNISKGYLDKARTVLLNHDPEKVVGRLEKYELREKAAGKWGLWGRIQVSNADDVADVRTKIKEKALNAFSFRWKGVPGGEEPLNKDQDGPFGPKRIKAGVILEVSIVSMPANPQAAIERWYEKALEALPSVGDDLVVAADVVKAAVAEAFKALTAELGIGTAKEADGKQDTATKSNDGEGEKENVMNEAMKKLVEKMTPELWASLDADTQKACKEIDNGIEARLANAKLAAENAALKKQIEESTKSTAAPATPPAPAAEPPKAEGALTAESVKKMVGETVAEALKQALGTTERKSQTTDGTRTTMLTDGEEDKKLKSMLSGAHPEGRELTAKETMEVILGSYFRPGTSKESRQKLDALVHEMAQ